MVPKPVAVIGLGNMGMSVAGAMLSRGLHVIAVDRDEQKRLAIERGETVVPERDADRILAEAIRQGRLHVQADCERAADWGACFLAVQTPADDGRCDYRVLQGVLRELSLFARPGMLVVIGSTVFPGAFEREILPAWTGPAVDIVYQPVFLRAGFGIDDFLHPGKIILGVRQPAAPPASVLAWIGHLVPDVAPSVVDYAEAEWIKMVHNAFMCMKIVFANEIGMLCADHGVDAGRVLELTLTEGPRGRLLTRSHTQPGVPFSGPCLPKDALVLARLVEASGQRSTLEQGVCQSLLRSNDAFRASLCDQWLSLAADDRRPLGIVGMSFRPGFNEMRHGLALDFVASARKAGVPVVLYDPAFEGIDATAYELACRQDQELLVLRPHFRTLEEVWETSQGVFLNRLLDEGERARVANLPAPPIVDVYDNRLPSPAAGNGVEGAFVGKGSTVG